MTTINLNLGDRGEKYLKSLVDAAKKEAEQQYPQYADSANKFFDGLISKVGGTIEVSDEDIPSEDDEAAFSLFIYGLSALLGNMLKNQMEKAAN